MSEQKIPKHYTSLRQRFPEVLSALEDVGKAARSSGPLDAKLAHLMQLAGAATLQSEGSVHSHARRALEAGATPEEIYQSKAVQDAYLGGGTTRE